MELKQLEKIENRYQELEHFLAHPEVISNKEQYNKHAKEFSDLKETVSLFREYKKAMREIEDLEVMLKEKHDPQFLELARKELQDLKNKLNHETQKIIHDCLKEANELLTKEKTLLDRFAKELLEKEELDYDQIQAIFNEYGHKRKI